jgi:hypothetical protein
VQHWRRKVQANDPTAPTSQAQRHDARSHSDLKDRPFSTREVGVYISGVFFPALFTTASLVAVIRNQIELGHHHVRYGVRAPMRTTAAMTISPKATDARRVITLAVGLMVSSIGTGRGSPNLGNNCELWT